MFYTLITLILAASTPSWAEKYETTVRDFQYNLKVGDTLIKKDQIQGKSLGQVLLEVPHLQVPVLGGEGQLQSIFLDGSKSEHVLVLLDGIPLNDLSSTAGAFDVSTLDATAIEAIVVRKGSQSVLHGGDAMAGVIEIYTRDPQNSFSEASLQVDSLPSFGASVAVAKAPFLVEAGAAKSSGIGSAAESAGNPEKDGFGKSHILLKHKTSSAQFSYLHSEKWNEYDQGTTPPADDLNAKSTQRSDRISGRGQFSDFQDLSWRASYARASRNEFDPEDNAGGSFRFENYLYQRQLAGLNFDPKWTDSDLKSQLHTGLLLESVDWQYEGDSSFSVDRLKKNRQQQSLFADGNFELADWVVGPGLRCDSFGASCDWQSQIEISRKLQAAQIYLKAGAAKRRPSFYQLYSAFGDLALANEESRSYRMGWASPDLSAEISQTDFSNLIDFDSLTSRYKNLASVTTQSAEIQKHFGSKAKAFAAYTKAVDNLTGQSLVRRSPYRLGINLSENSEPWNFSLDIFYKSTTEDTLTSSTRIKLAEYFLINASARLRLNHESNLEMQVMNLADQIHQDAYGYGSQGRTFALSFHQNF